MRWGWAPVSVDRAVAWWFCGGVLRPKSWYHWARKVFCLGVRFWSCSCVVSWRESKVYESGEERKMSSLLVVGRSLMASSNRSDFDERASSSFQLISSPMGLSRCRLRGDVISVALIKCNAPEALDTEHWSMYRERLLLMLRFSCLSGKQCGGKIGPLHNGCEKPMKRCNPGVSSSVSKAWKLERKGEKLWLK
jgi:hypothetical protein